MRHPAQPRKGYDHDHRDSVKECGYVFTWGRGFFGQLGRGMLPDAQMASKPTAVCILGGGGGSGGGNRNDNGNGNGNDNGGKQRYKRRHKNLMTRKIAAGANHCAAVTVAGILWTWGRNMYGCLGRNTSIKAARGCGENASSVASVPHYCVSLSRLPRGAVKDVACGLDYTIVATSSWADGVKPSELMNCSKRLPGKSVPSPLHLPRPLRPQGKAKIVKIVEREQNLTFIP